MIIPSKENILVYWNLLTHTEQKPIIFHYIAERLRGKKVELSEDLIITIDGLLYNCGRSLNNASVISPSFEPYMKDYYPDSGTVIDVGAHIGKHSIAMAKKLGAKGYVYAFEPTPETVKILRENKRLNDLKNLLIIPSAVGAEDTEITLYQDVRHPTTNSITKPQYGNGITVPMERLDSLGFSNPVTLIKIDAEGYELEVLKGAILTITLHKPAIIFEAWNAQAYTAIQDYLEDLGYSCVGIGDENYLARYKK